MYSLYFLCIKIPYSFGKKKGKSLLKDEALKNSKISNRETLGWSPAPGGWSKDQTVTYRDCFVFFIIKRVRPTTAKVYPNF